MSIFHDIAGRLHVVYIAESYCYSHLALAYSHIWPQRREYGRLHILSWWSVILLLISTNHQFCEISSFLYSHHHHFTLALSEMSIWEQAPPTAVIVLWKTVLRKTIHLAITVSWSAFNEKECVTNSYSTWSYYVNNLTVRCTNPTLVQWSPRDSILQAVNDHFGATQFCNIFLSGQTSSEDWIVNGFHVYSECKTSNKDSIHPFTVLAGLQLAIDNARIRGIITLHLFCVS